MPEEAQGLTGARVRGAAAVVITGGNICVCRSDGAREHVMALSQRL